MNNEYNTQASTSRLAARVGLKTLSEHLNVKKTQVEGTTKNHHIVHELSFCDFLLERVKENDASNIEFAGVKDSYQDLYDTFISEEAGFTNKEITDHINRVGQVFEAIAAAYPQFKENAENFIKDLNQQNNQRQPQQKYTPASDSDIVYVETSEDDELNIIDDGQIFDKPGVTSAVIDFTPQQ